LQAKLARPPLVAKRVLVVEDNIDDARMLATLIGMMGHRVEYAINATVAVTIAKAFVPEYLFVDLRLPDGHGADLVRNILSTSKIDVRAYAVTGSAGELDRQRALKAGCIGVLLKPVAAEDFEGILGRR
jgi:CheY-like chemotaxis protein